MREPEARDKTCVSAASCGWIGRSVNPITNVARVGWSCKLIRLDVGLFRDARPAPHVFRWTRQFAAPL